MTFGRDGSASSALGSSVGPMAAPSQFAPRTAVATDRKLHVMWYREGSDLDKSQGGSFRSKIHDADTCPIDVRDANENRWSEDVSARAQKGEDNQELK